MTNQPFDQQRPLSGPMAFESGQPKGGTNPVLFVGLGFGAAMLVAVAVIGFYVLLQSPPPPAVADRGDLAPVDAQPSLPAVAASSAEAPSPPAPVLPLPAVNSTADTTPVDPIPAETSTPDTTPADPIPVETSTPDTSKVPATPDTLPHGDDRSILADGENPLQYNWATGYQYRCDFSVDVKAGDAKQHTSGRTTYTPTDVDPATIGAEQTEGEGTGTAFAVNADGVFVTCAHVVRGSTKIDVHLNDVVHSGKVVVLDTRSDLAVVRIQTDEKIPFLPLHDSDQVELAQDVRVVGYPLSDMLGESVKISRGTIAGVVERERGNRFQVDASINPGNSGGPLIDEQGRVVGVASAMLVNESIDAVGFVVPSNEAVQLLKRREIAVTRQEDGEDLKGPELARRVTPAVALLKVQYGPGGFGMTEQRVVKYTGNSHMQMDDGSRFGGLMMGNSSHKSDSGTMLVDAQGEIASHDGVTSVPYPFAAIGTIGIESLPADEQTSWSSTRVTILVQSVEDSRSQGRYPGGIRPPPMIRSPRGGSPYGGIFGRPSPKVVVYIPALEEVRYKRGSKSADGTVEIHKEYELTTMVKDGDKPLLSVTSQGTITWDTSLGLPRKAEFEGTMSLNNEQVSVRLPLTISYTFTRVSDAEAKAELDAYREKAAEATRVREQKRIEEANAEAAEAAASGEAKAAAPSVTISDQHLSKRGLSAFRPDGPEEGDKSKE